MIKEAEMSKNHSCHLFGGTGTVSAVAHKTGRHSIHIDISKEYCETAKNRPQKDKEEMSQKKIS